MRTVEEKRRFKIELENRTAAFAVAVFRFLDCLPAKPSTRVISFQLGKSASSVGANYSEANRAESADDFVHKIGIVLKECSESFYWLELLKRLYPTEGAIENLVSECEELLRLFQSIRTKMYTKRKS